MGKQGDLENSELHSKSKGFKSLNTVPSKPSGSQKTPFGEYYQPLTCKDSAGNEYICLSKYEAISIVRLIEQLNSNPNLAGFDTGDWFRDVPAKVYKWLSPPKPIKHPSKTNDGGRNGG